MKQKIFTIIVALCATTVLWADGTEINGICYILAGDSATVTYLGSSCYADPHYSGNITIPATVTYQSQTYRVTSIGYCAFGDCTSLASVTIPNSVTSIEDRAFWKCTSLASVTIPNSVTRIGYDVFECCPSLASISVDAGNKQYSSEDGVLFTYAKDSLIQYPIGNSRATYTIPNSVTRIGEIAFIFCTSLASVTIPNSVTSIGDYTFYGCTSLADIYSYAEIPPSVGSAAFSEVNNHCYIHVPKGTIRAYQMATGWSDFYHFFEISDLPAGQTEVGVTVTNNYATFSWPVNPTASSYTLEIKKGGVLFCTLVFNNMGQLVGMSFAPGRGANQAPAAESTSYGYSFVVTGLSAYTTYDYTFTTLDSQGSVIETKNGTFETTEITAIENVNDNDNHNGNKVIRNGILLIERNGVYYNAQGAIVE